MRLLKYIFFTLVTLVVTSCKVGSNYNDNSSNNLSTTTSVSSSAVAESYLAQPLFGWMSGSKLKNQPGVYGSQGYESDGNVPGARMGSISWTDENGYMWLFGGIGYNPLTGKEGGVFNDLWKYDVVTNRWAWIRGYTTQDQPGIYGLKGITSNIDLPGGRTYLSSWTDKNGNLWLFGGYGNAESVKGELSDLWKYNISTNNWTWVSGSKYVNQRGRYGQQGTASTDNSPGGRHGSVSWTDKDGNLWLFGGYGFDSEGDTGALNDLWKYNPNRKEWTWVRGSKYKYIVGQYGQQGIEDAGTFPGSRYGSVSWTDKNGNLWLFGGHGPDANVTLGYLNDLWKFNTSTNRWTWVSGSEYKNQSGIYGEKGVEGHSNVPGSREYSISWTDKNGNFWLFGGYGYDYIGKYIQQTGALNDLWKYNTSTNKWTWVSGSKSKDGTGRYGTKGIARVNNIPKAKVRSTGWTDKNGNLWLFGGNQSTINGANPDPGKFNDLWKITIYNNYQSVAYITDTYDWSIHKCYIDKSGNLINCENTAGSYTLNPWAIKINQKTGYAYITGTVDLYLDDPHGLWQITKCKINSNYDLTDCGTTGGQIYEARSLAFASKNSSRTIYLYATIYSQNNVSKCTISNIDGSLSDCRSTGSSLINPVSIAVESNNYAFIANFNASTTEASQLITSCVIYSDGELVDCQRTGPIISQPRTITLDTAKKVAYIGLHSGKIFMCSYAGRVISESCTLVGVSLTPTNSINSININNFDKGYDYIANGSEGVSKCPVTPFGLFSGESYDPCTTSAVSFQHAAGIDIINY